jgi:HK97 family phage portal protein
LLTHLDGRQTRHDTSDLVHIKLPLSLDGVVALSPVAQCRAALGLNLALTQEATALMQNASAPRGVLSISSSPASEDLLVNLERDFSQRHQGPEKAGRVAVLSSDVSFTALSLSPHDAEFVEQRKLSTQEICRIWAIPPWMLNAPSNDSMTYSNTESQAAAFAKFTLSPYLCAVEQALTNSPLCVGPTTYVEFLLDGLLRPDTLARYQAYAIALGDGTSPGFMTREEVRQRENLPPETATGAA